MKTTVPKITLDGWEQTEPDVSMRVLHSILCERVRQSVLKEQGKFLLTCADLEMTHPERLAVLGEEFGEVCHEVNEPIGGKVDLDRVKLRTELVQVAAVCVAWIEALDKEMA